MASLKIIELCRPFDIPRHDKPSSLFLPYPKIRERVSTVEPIRPRTDQLGRVERTSLLSRPCHLLIDELRRQFMQTNAIEGIDRALGFNQSPHHLIARFTHPHERGPSDRLPPVTALSSTRSSRRHGIGAPFRSRPVSSIP
ncbi:hypothetical protein [Sinosporangium siamense]|uniref:hypothetical protein n=1 Tax=Sinosporangium siamense TaxID=1367973 RepID=UPI0027DB5358|nr:hypothetical protein [Sinosporangium siamense]